MTKNQETGFKCPVCGLHYKDKKHAEMCEAWCSVHESCNIWIASNSIEAQSNRKRGR